MDDVDVKIVIAGRPASGKTVLALLMREVFRKHGFTNLIVSDMDLDPIDPAADLHHIEERTKAISNRKICIETRFIHVPPPLPLDLSPWLRYSFHDASGSEDDHIREDILSDLMTATCYAPYGQLCGVGTPRGLCILSYQMQDNLMVFDYLERGHKPYKRVRFWMNNSSVREMLMRLFSTIERVTWDKFLGGYSG